MKKRMISVLMAFAMLMAGLPLQVLANPVLEPMVSVSRILHRQIVEKNQNGQTIEKRELSLKGIFTSGGTEDFSIVGVEIYRKSSDLGGGNWESFLKSSKILRSDNNTIDIDFSELDLSPGETLVPRVFYKYRGSGGTVDSWNGASLEEYADANGIKMGSILSMNPKETDKLSKAEKSSSISFDISANVDSNAASEEIATYLKFISGSDPVKIFAEGGASQYIESDVTNYTVERIVPNNAIEGKNEIIVRNHKEPTEFTSEIVYRTIDIKPVPDYSPVIGNVSVLESPVKEDESGPDKNQVIAEIKGENFIVESGETPELPQVYLLPKSKELEKDIEVIDFIKDLEEKDESEKAKYKASHKNGAVYRGNKEINGVRDYESNIAGDRMVVVFPASESPESRQIVVVNPNGKISRYGNTVSYEERDSKEAVIHSVHPKKVDAAGGDEVVITSSGLSLDKARVKVTIDGSTAEIASIERDPKDIRKQILKIKTPEGSLGEKAIQIISESADGNQLSLDSYGWNDEKEHFEYVDGELKPSINRIDPPEGGPGTKIIIHGDGFDEKAEVIFEGSEGKILVKPADEAEGETVNINGRTIEFFISEGAGLKPGSKKVIVRNSNGQESKENAYFYFRDPSGIENPEIKEVNPNYAIKGGNRTVHIKGENFKEGIRVMFGDRQAKVISLNGAGTTVTVEIPEYTEPKAVDVTVYNRDTGSDTAIGAFEYFEGGKTIPKIEKIINTATKDNTGSTRGGEEVVIRGEYFRRVKDADGNYILPQVYFGSERVVPDVKSWREGRDFTDELTVKTPAALEHGEVDVIVLNPVSELGESNKSPFIYKRSAPKIVGTVPNPPTIYRNGSKDTNLYIEGEEFIRAEKGSYRGLENAEIEVKFGEESAEEEIRSGRAAVSFGKALEVRYDRFEDEKIRVITSSGEESYAEDIEPGKPFYVKVSTSLEGVEKEGIKISTDGFKLKVERRVSVGAEFIDEFVRGGKVISVVKVSSPPMDGIGKRRVTVVNIDGAEAKAEVEVINPASSPVISDISEKSEVIGPEGEPINYAAFSGAQGGITFDILGSGFQRGAKVQIGGVDAVINHIEDGKINVTSPPAKNFVSGRNLKVIVVNPDGAVAEANSVGALKLPFYYVYRNDESKINIVKVEKNEGSALGGQRVVITGTGFKLPNVEVYFGSKKAKVLKDESNDTKLVVTTPPSDIAGFVNVTVENSAQSDFATATLRNGFKYTSAPLIYSVNPRKVYSTGGEKVVIRGKGFMEGVEVEIAGERVETVFIDSRTIEITTPSVELPKDVDEVEKTVVAINPDGGKSEPASIVFIRPFPQRPTGFEAKAEDGRLVSLKWDKVKSIERYRLEISESEKGPFTYLGETKDGALLAKDLEPGKTYYFRLWALNEYGQSKNYAAAVCKTLTDAEDSQSGSFEDELESKTEVFSSGSEIRVNYSRKHSKSNYTHDFTAPKHQNFRKISLNVPAETIAEGKGTLTVKLKDMEIKAPLSMLRSESEKFAKGETLSVEITKLFSADKSLMQRLGRSGERAVGEGLEFKFTVGNGQNNRTLESLKSINLSYTTGEKDLSEGRIYSFRKGEAELKEETSFFEKLKDEASRKESYSINSNISRSGYYMPFGK